MSKAKEEFDAEQGHGNHLDSILDGISVEDLLKMLPKLLQEAKVIAAPKEKVSCALGKIYPAKLRFALMKETDNPLHLSMLIGCNINGKQNELLSFYPEYDGAPVGITLTEIHEWRNGVEAALKGTLEGSEHEIAIFDTRVANKGKYIIGETYTFCLAALAFNGEIMENRTFSLEGDKAVEYRKKTHAEPECDEEGKPKPVLFDMSGMVALFQSFKRYPHVAEFQSPIFGVSETTAFFGNFYVFDIAVERDDSRSNEIHVPLIIKKSFFKEKPKKDDPVRGILWMQGYLIASKEFSAKDMAEIINRAWTELDCTEIRKILADDFEYTSQRVLETMHGADKYLEYLSGKFETLRSGGKPTITAVRHNSRSIELDMEQSINGKIIRGMLLFDIADGKLSKACMCDPLFRRL